MILCLRVDSEAPAALKMGSLQQDHAKIGHSTLLVGPFGLATLVNGMEEGKEAGARTHELAERARQAFVMTVTPQEVVEVTDLSLINAAAWRIVSLLIGCSFFLKRDWAW